MSNRTLNLTDTVYHYMLDHSLRETDVMRRLREETSKLAASNMQIAPEQGQFMALLLELAGAKRVIEVGTFTGYSALCMAQSLPDDGKLICCDVSEEWTAVAKHYWAEAGVDQKISLRLAPALETLDELLESGQVEAFDAAFVDADKTNYINYYERCLRLVRPGGMLMFDNTLWDGSVADEANQKEDTVAIRELNDHVHRDDRVSVSLVPIGDGLTLIRKRI